MKYVYKYKYEIKNIIYNTVVKTETRLEIGSDIQDVIDTITSKLKIEYLRFYGEISINLVYIVRIEEVI